MSNDTPQDARIRALMVELSESSPLAPTAEELGLSTRPVTVNENEALPSYTEVSSMVVKDNTKGRRVFAGLAATITMLVGGSMAFNAASDGGNANPEAAVEQLLDAMADEDAIGMIESIDPDERRSITPHIDDLVAELERVELLGGVDTGAVAGFDFSFEGVELASRQLGDGVWAVRLVEGTFKSSTNSGALPLGAEPAGTDEVSDFAEGLDEWVASWPELFASEDFEIVVTNDDGWHVNVVYTFMEQIRKDEGWPEPDYLSPINPSGAASPQEAAEAWITAQGNWDVAAIIDLLDPVEMPAVHRYAEQLAKVVEDEGDGFYAPASTMSFDQVRVDGEGNERTVVIEQFSTTQRYEDSFGGTEESIETVTSFDGRCREISNNGGGENSFSQETCIDSEDLTAPSRALIVATPVEIRVVERDGAWFVSPAGTVVDHALDGLRVRNADGFDSETVLFTLFEIPVIPFYVPGGATGIIASGPEGFGDDSMFVCEVILEGGFTTEEQAATAADDYSTCIVENDIDRTMMGDRTAEISCSHIFSPYDEQNRTLDDALAVSEEFGTCLSAKGGDPMIAAMVGDIYCSNLESEQEWACTEQFGSERPIAVGPAPEICTSVFESLEEGELTEAEFTDLLEEFPECFGE